MEVTCDAIMEMGMGKPLWMKRLYDDGTALVGTVV